MQKNSKDQKLFNVSSLNDDLDMKEGLMDFEYNILYLYLYICISFITENLHRQVYSYLSYINNC